MALTSPPAQKPFPAPVNTTHFTEGSSSAQASCSAKARFMGSLIALRASGLLRVSVSTPFSNTDKRSDVPVSGEVVMVLFRGDGLVVDHSRRTFQVSTCLACAVCAAIRAAAGLDAKHHCRLRVFLT